MKGVILAGGLGTRLYPLTRITNKHLLPIYDKPMIYYPIEKLVQAGIRDILIVTGGNFAGDFLMLLRNGKEFGLKEIKYAYQEGQGGIAEALSLAEDFAENEKIVVILGDNVIEDDLAPHVKSFEKQEKGAKIFLKEVDHPQRFGVAVIKKDKIIKIDEKPKKPKSPYAVTGIYMYDNEVFNVVKTCKPSARGEMEITDVNNNYIRQGLISYSVLKGFWSDAGTFDSLYKASELVRKKKNKKERIIS